MNKLLNDALRAKGYKEPDIKMVLTDVNDPNGPYYTAPLTNVVVFDRKMLASANRNQILNALGHEFGHYSKEDNKTGTQAIANYSGEKLEDRTKGMVSKEATEDTLARIRNNKNVITGEEGKKLAESIPMERRECYKAFIVKGSVTKMVTGVEIDGGVIYNKDPVTGEEEFGYVFGGQGKFGIDYNFKKIDALGKISLKGDLDLDAYEDEGKPIKDFQGFIGGVEIKLAFLGYEIDWGLSIGGNKGESYGKGGYGDKRVKLMGSAGYIHVFKIDNPSEAEKTLIRGIANNSKTIVNVVDFIKIMKGIKDNGFKKNNIKKIEYRQYCILYYYALLTLIIFDFIAGVFLISNLIRFESLIFIIVFGIVIYFFTRAIVNCLKFFISKEECYCKNENLIYKRILFKKFLLEELIIPLLDIEEVLDKGHVDSENGGGNYASPTDFVFLFFKPYKRILLN